MLRFNVPAVEMGDEAGLVPEAHAHHDRDHSIDIEEVVLGQIIVVEYPLRVSALHEEGRSRKRAVESKDRRRIQLRVNLRLRLLQVDVI